MVAIRLSRGGNNTWQAINPQNTSIPVADDGEFTTLPNSQFPPNGGESVRQVTNLLNGVLTTAGVQVDSNTLDDDLHLTNRMNGSDTTLIVIITAGVNAVFSAVDENIPIVIGDLCSFRIDFQDPADTGSVTIRSGGIAGR